MPQVSRWSMHQTLACPVGRLLPQMTGHGGPFPSLLLGTWLLRVFLRVCQLGNFLLIFPRKAPSLFPTNLA